MTKKFDEIINAAKEVYHELSASRIACQNKGIFFDLPEYIEIDRMRFYFSADGSITVRSATPLKGEHIALANEVRL